MTRSPALSQSTASRGLVHLGAGVLRVGVVDVEPGAVGEDHVGQAEVLVGELAGVGHRRGSGRSRARRAAGDSSSKSQRSGPGGPRAPRWRSVDDLAAAEHRVGVRVAGHRDAVLGLGPHHPAHAHGLEGTRQADASAGASPPASASTCPGEPGRRSVAGRATVSRTAPSSSAMHRVTVPVRSPAGRRRTPPRSRCRRRGRTLPPSTCSVASPGLTCSSSGRPATSGHHGLGAALGVPAAAMLSASARRSRRRGPA